MQVKLQFQTLEAYRTVTDGNCGYDATTHAVNNFMSSCCPSDLVAADLRLGPHNTKVTIDDMRRLVFDSSSISDDDYVNIIGSMKNVTTTRQKIKVVVHAGESLLSMNLYMKALIHVAIFHLGFLVLWRR